MIINILPKHNHDFVSISNGYLIQENISNISVLSVLIDAEDISDTNVVFFLELYISKNNKTFNKRAAMSCVGIPGEWKEPPSLAISSRDTKGLYVKVKLTVNKKINIGIDMEDKNSVGEVRY